MNEFKSKNEIKPVRRDWRELHAKKKKRKMELVESYLEQKYKCENSVSEVTSESDDKITKQQVKDHLAMAVSGSIIDYVQTHQLMTYVIGQIGRAAAIYKVDEIIVFDDSCSSVGQSDENCGKGATYENCLFFAKVLEYMECPQYLRRSFFQYDEDLNYAGVLNPLRLPHHLKVDEISTYREGIVLDEKSENGKYSLVDIGLNQKYKLDQIMEPGLRVTVKLDGTQGKGKAVSPLEPRVKLGEYWGYTVRVAPNLSSVFTDGPHKKPYNLTIGTSDKGEPLRNIEFRSKKRNRILVVFGGVEGLEYALSKDEKLKSVEDVSTLFDHYVNTCPEQGSKTIRTEEAVYISMALISEKILSAKVKDQGASE